MFYGGAGVSTASGIPDFRSEDGLYSSVKSSVPAEEILSATFFALHTAEFYDFYRRYMLHPDAQPNAAHRYLYELEKADKLRGIVTQNIDGLHKRAGNKRVYELHGSIYENYCVHCETEYPLEKITHVFFHTLIYDTSLAFDGDFDEAGMRDDVSAAENDHASDRKGGA